MDVILEKQFRAIVEAELKEKGWSRSELGRRTGLGPQMVTDYLNGRRSPGPNVIEKFFAALDLEAELVGKRKPEPAA